MASTADLPLDTSAPDPIVLSVAPAMSSPLKVNAVDQPNHAPDNDDDDGEITNKRKKSKTPEDEELEKQIEALAVPGYSIHQEGVFTVIKRVNYTGRSRTFPARLAR